MSVWEIIHADGTVCETIEGDEDYATAVVHYYDSTAGTGSPMSCSPHAVRLGVARIGDT